MRKISPRDIAITGLMMAVVMVATHLRIVLPIGVGRTMVHLGNAACLLSAFLLGPVLGGLSAGFGSFLFDILDPFFSYAAPFTLVFKFIMAFSCGAISRLRGQKAENFSLNIFAAIVGSLVYVMLNFVRNYITNVYFLGMRREVALLLMAKKLVVAGVNAAAAVVVSVLLYKILQKASPKKG